MPIEKWRNAINTMIENAGVIKFGNDDIQSYIEELIALEKCKVAAQVYSLLEFVTLEQSLFRSVFATAGKTPSNF